MKTVKLSSKGQVTLPIEVVRAVGARKGTEFVVVQEGDRIVLAPARAVGKRVVDDLEGWDALSASSLNELWDNPEDEVWNDV